MVKDGGLFPPTDMIVILEKLELNGVLRCLLGRVWGVAEAEAPAKHWDGKPVQ